MLRERTHSQRLRTIQFHLHDMPEKTHYSDRKQKTDYQRLKRGRYDCKGVEEEMGDFGGEKTSAS